MEEIKLAKVVNIGRATNAEEWAMRQAMSIVNQHLPDADFEKSSALISDIAEALTSVRRACNNGLM